jgi:flavin-dependent dehydrogenase
MEMKTVAIIGGGPAGAVAALRLIEAPTSWCVSAVDSAAEHRRSTAVASRTNYATATTPVLERGTRVLVFEEKRGWEKPCGGGLPYKALRQYPFLLEASNPHVCIRSLELVAANGDSVRFPLHEPLAIYSRATLNGLLLRRAEEAGAEVVQERVLGFSRANGAWKIDSRNGTYAADYLILAAGARTRLRGLLAPHFAPRDFMLTFGYYAPGADDLARVQFFDDFEGYAWSFPRTDHLSLGICGKAGKSKTPELRDRLREFMKQFGYAQSTRAAEGLSVFSHLLPALSHESWHNLRLSGPGWALVGDAAGLVDPVTGEGIYFAMRSGELLAESLLAGTPEEYPERVWQDFGRKLALGARLGHFFYHEDFLGQAPTTRFIQLAARSTGFMNLLQSFIDGSQSYSGLTARLYKTVGQALVEIATASIRNQLSPARATEQRKNSDEVWPREHQEPSEQGVSAGTS